MDLVCSDFTLTWYPGAIGSTTSPWVLLATTDLLDGMNPMGGSLGQLVQRADHLRADGPEHYARGNRSGGLAFTRYRKETSPRDAMEDLLGEMISVPGVTGWVKIEIAGKATVWSLDQAVIESVAGGFYPGRGLRGTVFGIRGGDVAVYSGAAPDTVYTVGEFLLEETDRGALLLESAS